MDYQERQTGTVLARNGRREAVDFLLEWFAELRDRSARTNQLPGDICITCFGVGDPSPITLDPQVVSALASLGAAGWRVRELRSVSGPGLHRVAEEALQTFQFSENFTVRCVSPESATEAHRTLPSEELVIAQMKGGTQAAQIFSVGGSDTDSPSLLFFPDVDQAGLIYQRFVNLERHSPLLVQVAQQSKEDWEFLTRDTELLVGERLQARELFTTLSDSDGILFGDYRSLGFTENLIPRLLELHRERVQALHDQVGGVRFMNIAERATVERYIASGYRPRGGYVATPEDVLAQVHTEIEWLRTYPNYHLGLTEKRLNVAFMIKADQVLFERIEPSGPGSSKTDAAAVTYQSNALVEVFRDQFGYLWSKIPIPFRDDERVATWLEEQIEKSDWINRAR